MNEGKPVTDDAVSACAAKAVKMRREAIEQFEGVGRAELAEKEKKELECLSAFVPALLSEDDTRRRRGGFWCGEYRRCHESAAEKRRSEVCIRICQGTSLEEALI